MKLGKTGRGQWWESVAVESDDLDVKLRVREVLVLRPSHVIQYTRQQLHVSHRPQLQHWQRIAGENVSETLIYVVLPSFAIQAPLQPTLEDKGWLQSFASSIPRHIMRLF
jgi:hypothetical protein